MEYPAFMADKRLQEAADAYKDKYGGRFGGGEPDGGLMYETEDGETACVPPDGATTDQVLKDLKSGKPLPELWPELEYDPDLLY